LNDLKKYKLPIYITENGLPDIRDEKRAQFIGDHLLFIKKAMNEGVDVRGYLYWSLLDNFEWDSGFWPRFGLVEVDYRTLERKIRPSALVYKKIIETWQT
jgi:beta-glucosidase